MWTRSLACCIALLTLVAPPVLGIVPDDAVLRGACSDAHWLAISTATVPVPSTADSNARDVAAQQPVCPNVLGWTVRPLFAGLDYSGPLFCRYDRQGDSKATFPVDAKLHAAVPLCGVVVPLDQAGRTILVHPGEESLGSAVLTFPSNSTSLVAPLDSEFLYRELRFQVGATDLPLKSSTPLGVRLAVVDTQPTGDFGASSVAGQGSPHGFDLAAIARDLTCTKSGDDPHSPVGLCASAITTRLALNMSSAGDPPTTDETRGGYFGRPSDIALAIVREVDAWLAAGSPRHLVLNLSIGWDPDLLHSRTNAEDTGAHLNAEEPGTHLNAEELAVYAALAYARAKGALPIAASGNSPGGSQPGHGATAPGRWFATPPDTGGYFTATSPVVWAVGAVDRDDRPLANVRAASLPPLVAFGDHAVAPLPSGPGWTVPPLTGSSVSAIVASSIAAVAWDLRPDLEADAIVMLLAKSGRELQRPAEIYLPGSDLGLQPASTSSNNGGQPPSIRRLWFHSALSRAWSREQLYETGKSWAADDQMTCVAHLIPNCGSTWGCAASTGQTLPCPPSLLSIASVPWVLPQPGQDPCPTCSISSGVPPQNFATSGSPGSGPTPVAHAQMRQAQAVAAQEGTVPASTTQTGQQSWEIEISIPSNWKTGASNSSNCFSSLVLEAGTNRLVIVPPGGQICAGKSLQVTGLPFDPGQGTAAITFQIANPVAGQLRSVRSPIYRDWQP